MAVSGVTFLLSPFSFLAKNECHPLRLDGCQHFCYPGPESYTCSCARGHTLGQDRRSCLPHGESPPGLPLQRL